MKRNYNFIRPHREHRSKKNRNFRANNEVSKGFKQKKEKLKLKELENDRE
jgi:hypothetical protein